MEQRYIRNLGALTEDECAVLQGKKVFVAGCGGLGGHIIDMLLRLGIGGIRVADGDIFDASNLNRQLLSTPSVTGFSKASVASAYAGRVNPDVEFEAVSAFVTEENVSALTDGCDLVFDALDNIPSRLLLQAECARKGIPYVFGAVGGWSAMAALLLPGDLLLRDLYPDGASDEERGTLSFVPALCAAFEVSLGVKHLCGRCASPGTLWCFDLGTMEFHAVT